jgi:DNA-binding response OmpR family regulator
VDNTEIDIVPGRLVAAPHDGPVVLIIEDNPSQAEFIATIVASLGYEFELAADGSEGLAKVREVRPVLILLDLHMPRFDGAGFLTRFQRTDEFAEVPVIVITASQSIDTITKVCAMGARDFIAKPLDPAALIAKVQKHAPIKRRR